MDYVILDSKTWYFQILLFQIKISDHLGPDSDLDSDAQFDDLFSDDSHDTGPDEPESPTVLLDKKTRRRFLDLGLVSYKSYCLYLSWFS